MKYDVQWNYTIKGNTRFGNYATMIEAEANESYEERLKWLRAEKASGVIQSFEICILVCTKLVQE